MKNFLLPLMAILLLTACQKEIKTTETQEEIAGGSANKQAVVLTTICDQVWMVKNLDVTKYRNGDNIPQVTDPTAWASLTTGAWCYYGNNSANGKTYGKLYNWYAVTDPRGLAQQAGMYQLMLNGQHFQPV